MAIYTQVAIRFLVKYGMGRHYEYILPTLPKLIETFIIGGIVSCIAVGLVKISICLFVLRLIQGTHPRTRIALYITLSLNTVVTLVATITLGFQCKPLRKAWNLTIEGSCFTNQDRVNIVRVVGGMLPWTLRFLYWKTVETEQQCSIWRLYRFFMCCGSILHPQGSADEQRHQVEHSHCFVSWAIVSPRLLRRQYIFYRHTTVLRRARSAKSSLPPMSPFSPVCPLLPSLSESRHDLTIARAWCWVNGLVIVRSLLSPTTIIAFICLKSPSLELFLGIFVASLPTLRPLLVTATQSIQNHWRSYFSKGEPIKSTSVQQHDFAVHTRAFERLEFDFDDAVMR